MNFNGTTFADCVDTFMGLALDIDLHNELAFKYGRSTSAVDWCCNLGRVGTLALLLLGVAHNLTLNSDAVFSL